MKALAELSWILLDERMKEVFRKLQPVKSEMNVKVGMAPDNSNKDKR